MKVKPKEVLVNIPVVYTLPDENDNAMLASNFNTFLHGKVRLKYDYLGKLGDQYVSIFYFHRNDEFHELRNSFMEMIEQEEMSR